MSRDEPPQWHGTTILCVRKGAQVVVAGDGQVTLGNTVIKSNAKKVRRVGKGNVIAGFAGATADAFALFERLEAKLEQHPEPAGARLRRAGQGLAHRSLSAPPRGHDGGRRQAGQPGADGHRRRAGAGRRPHRHRLRRQLRAGRRARAHRQRHPLGRGHRPQGHGNRRRHLHLHQPQHPAREVYERQPAARRAPGQGDRGQLQPARDRLRARPLHRRPARRQARRRHRAAQPLAPPAAVGGAARGGAAQEHPDDRPHRRRQDRDRPPPRQARAGAVHQGRGHQVHRGRLCRPRRRADRARSRGDRHQHDAREAAPPGRGQGRGRRRGARARRPRRRGRQRRHPRQVPAHAAHRRAERPRDRAEREGLRQHRAADLRDPRHARRQHGHDQPERDPRPGLRRPHQAATHDRRPNPTTS